MGGGRGDPRRRQTDVVDRDLTLLATISSATDMHEHADEALAVLARR